MSHRIGIANALIKGMKWEFDGEGDYFTDIKENIKLGDIHFEDVRQWPLVTVSPGPEIRTYQASGLTECRLSLYIRVYVKDEEDAQGQVESLFSDIETYLDNNLDLEYNVETPNDVTQEFRTVTNTIVSLNTSEGLLSPDEIGEVTVEIRYHKYRGND